MSTEQISLHLAIKSAGIRSRWSHLLTSASINFSGCRPGHEIRRSLCTLRAWIDAAGSVNRSSMDADVNRADKLALCQSRTRAAALDRDSRDPDVGLVNALPDPVTTANPYPLAWTRARLFDDWPSVNVDICRRGYPAPKDRIRFRGTEKKGCRKAGNGNADQKHSMHWFHPPNWEASMLRPIHD